MLKLESEQRTYEANLPGLLKAGEGQYVVIRGDDICKIEPTYEAALTWGYEHLGLGSFMVKEIRAVERKVFFSRHAGLCAG